MLPEAPRPRGVTVHGETYDSGNVPLQGRVHHRLNWIVPRFFDFFRPRKFPVTSLEFEVGCVSHDTVRSGTEVEEVRVW